MAGHQRGKTVKIEKVQLLIFGLCILESFSVNCKEIQNQSVEISRFHSIMEITEILSHTFWQKFRENNDFTKEVTKELI